MRNVTASISVGPSPRRARATASRVTRDHRQDVVAVHAHAGEAVALRLDRQALGGGLAREWHRDRPLVVLDEEHHGSFGAHPAKFAAAWKSPVEVAPSPR